MKVVVIGATGHVGTWLVPMLVEAGHEVIAVSRQTRKPYHSDPRWERVQMLSLDREMLESKQRFGEAIASLKPEIVIDMICFTPESARQIVTAVKGSVLQFLHCGTIWVHGHSTVVPATEELPRNPFGTYGINKAAIEEYLLNEFAESEFPATVLHPGHISGPGWVPVNPAGNINPQVYRKLKNGEPLALPNIGMETVHHVHAADVAQAFVKAIEHRDGAVGHSFHVVSPQAMTLRGYASLIAEWYGHSAELQFLPWEEWKQTVSEKDAAITWDHIAHSPSASIEKARRLIGYEPKYSSIEAVKDALRMLDV